jgi:alcohol dehydrogenase class IV
MQFEFATAGRIIFGAGRIGEVGDVTHPFGQRAFVIVDSTERTAPVLEILRNAHVSLILHPIHGEPTIASISAALQDAREGNCELVVGIGGGSALDSGKAVAALLTNPGELTDFLEVIGKGQVLSHPSVPFIAIPTTAGTGSEVTRNAVISSPEHRLKASLRSPFMLPRVALVDPELTYSLPPEPTASTGMDTLTQLIEPFTSNSPNPLVDAICREGIPLVAKSLQSAYENGQDTVAREGMALGSLLGGMALANGRLGAVHGMANPIGGMAHAPHGAICARLLPMVLETNIRAIRSRAPDSPSIKRYEEVAHLLTGNEAASAEDGIKWVQELCRALRIRPLGNYGLNRDDFDPLVAQSQKANSMKGNAIPLSNQEIRSLLEKSI